MDLDAAVQGPDDAGEILSVALCCQPDWQASGLAEGPRDPIHDVNACFCLPTILK